MYLMGKMESDAAPSLFCFVFLFIFLYRSSQYFLLTLLNYLYYLCFAGRVLFQFLAFGLISHTIRTLNRARLCLQR